MTKNNSTADFIMECCKPNDCQLDTCQYFTDLFIMVGKRLIIYYKRKKLLAHFLPVQFIYLNENLTNQYLLKNTEKIN